MSTEVHRLTESVGSGLGATPEQCAAYATYLVECVVRPQGSCPSHARAHPRSAATPRALVTQARVVPQRRRSV